MIALLALLAALADAPQERAAANEDAQLEQLISESRICLKQEVDRQISTETLFMSDEERSRARMSAASNCHRHDKEIARFANDYRSGSKTLDEVSELILAVSLRIADAMIMTRIRANTEKSAHAPNH